MAERADEPALIARVVLRDDHAAFAELVRLHQSAVRRFLRRLTRGDAERADDLAQDTFLKAYRHLASYAGRGPFASWLLRIAFQRFLEHERRRRLERAPLPAEPELPARLAPGTPAFDQLIAELRADERAAVTLHFRDELSHPEIAEALDRPLGTVKSLLRRALSKLRAAHRDEEPR